METPTCFSQYFINKQNIRSIDNIIRRDLLKSETNEFLMYIFEREEYLVKSLPDELASIIIMMKNNTREKSKDDFKSYFKFEDEKGKLQVVEKQVILETCLEALNDILPKQIFGGNPNIKIFSSLIGTVVYSMRRQHFLLKKFIEKWDFTVVPWVALPNIEAKKTLYYILMWILKCIIAAMISLNFYVTTCKIDSDENKLHYFWKPQWQSFYDKNISKMVFTRVIKKCNSLSLGSKLKKNHSLHERLKLKKSIKKNIPKLHLVLKTNNDCRPIVRYRNGVQNPAEKYKMKERLMFLKILTGKCHQKIENQFTDLHNNWARANNPKLYFVKTDLSNAFGSVNRDKLQKILSERHLEFQRTEKNVSIKKKMAHHYKETITELQTPLLVRAGSTVFEWNKGLVQGYKYSPALSELYYTYMDEQYFSKHLVKSESRIKLFTRVVDDYLYVTDCLDDANSFLDALSNYRNVNYAKTVVNFDHLSIKISKDITFLGYSYNTEKMEVSRAPNVFVGQMCYKIAFTGAILDTQKFLENRIGQSGIQINGHIFNLVHNPEDLIWRHIYTTFCLSANKFCTILAVLCDEKEMLEHISLYKKRVVVKLSNSIIETLLRNNSPCHPFVYCINHFRYLSWKALYLCAKGIPKCSGIIPMVKNELAKTNCLFGKWKEHASNVDTNGETSKVAVKDVCRRSDLRAIVKNFDSLPEGFECYNHKKIYNKTK